MITSAAKEWGWRADFTDLAATIKDFVNEVKLYGGRLTRLELNG
jgi:hypothetical protein